MEPNKDYDNNLNNLESDNQEAKKLSEQPGGAKDQKTSPDDTADDFAYVSEDKYLALEQEGVQYTPDSDPMGRNPDNLEYRQHGQESGLYDANNRNSRNSEAFSQDEYILRDNIDLDEDQSQSISSEDDFDTNTNDER